jgi:Bacterial toxin 24
VAAVVSSVVNDLTHPFGSNTDAQRTIKVGPDPAAEGAHSVPKPASAGGAKNGYTEYDKNGNPQKRYRGSGRPHGGVDPPYILEPKAGKGPGAKPIVPRPATPEEIPQ